MPRIYSQAPIDNTILNNTWQVSLFDIFMILVLTFVTPVNPAARPAIFGCVFMLSGLRLLTRYSCARETRYEIEEDVLTIRRPWPFKRIRVDLNEIRIIKRVTLDAIVLIVSMTSSQNPAPSMSKRMMVPLALPHKLRESDVNSYNCVLVTPGRFSYKAYPPTHTDIKVFSLLTDAQSAVLLEGPVNYLISPADPKRFVTEISPRIGGQVIT